jgi:hypothetical protein
LFDLKTTYTFQTTPGVDRYNMPLYSVQTQQGNQDIHMYPVYQGFAGPAYVNGVQCFVTTQKDSFFNLFPNFVQQNIQVGVGDGGTTYALQLPILSASTNTQNPPFSGILRGHVDMSGIIATGNNQDPPVLSSANVPIALSQIATTSISPGVYITSLDATGSNVVVSDSGLFLSGNVNYGILIQPGNAPTGHSALVGTYSTTVNTVNYLTGEINVTFPTAIPAGQNINVQALFFQSGLPRSILYYNNTLTLRAPPAMQYPVQLDCYLSPGAFLSSSNALPFAYMGEYIARGAARKILSDTGDVEQFQFYEPLFREQEALVWKRSQRQFTSNRTQTIYSMGPYMGGYSAGGMQ